MVQANAGLRHKTDGRETAQNPECTGFQRLLEGIMTLCLDRFSYGRGETR